jgi:glycosyltransferase involved in cell wall biosynthesis
VNVAVLSLTRDRLHYTQHCFGTLVANAGCDFDWFITDQGSEDGTVDWLHANTDATIYSFTSNIGICPALNRMLDDALELADYDVIIKIDNDCELLTPSTIKDVCEKALEHDAILSPHIRGLREPPHPIGRVDGIAITPVVGGIFMAVPADVFKDGYRHPINATRDGDDWQLCRWFQAQDGIVGYVDGYEANHYETTDGQHARYPDYFARREQERRNATLVMV